MAESLARLLENVPSFGRFLAAALPALLLPAAALFAARRRPAITGLRRQVDRLLGWLVAAILLVMVVLSGLQILLRNLFDAGFLWIDPLLRHLVLILAFAGAVIATGRKRHIQINVLGRLLSGTARRVAGTVIALGSGVICLALGHASLGLLFEELEFGATVFLGIPAWVVAAVFPISFGTLAFRFFYLAFLEVVGEAPAAGEEGPVEPHELPGPEWRGA